MKQVGRLVVAIVVGIILLAGVYFYMQLRGGGGEEEPTAEELINTDVIEADEQPNTQRVVSVAGFDVVLNTDPAQETILVSELPPPSQPTNTPQPTADPSLILATATPIPPTDPTATPRPVVVVTAGSATSNRGDIVLVDHVVQPADTLYGIATRHRSSVALMAEYGIAQDHLIPGTTIRVPVAAPGACAANQTPHIVVDGENVFRLALRYSTTQEAIRAANPEIPANYTIYAGDVVCIPS